MSKYWEIVRLSSGSFALRSSKEGESPLVKIEFSEEAIGLFEDQLTDVARVMIGAGVQAVSMIQDAAYEPQKQEKNLVLH